MPPIVYFAFHTLKCAAEGDLGIPSQRSGQGRCRVTSQTPVGTQGTSWRAQNLKPLREVLIQMCQGTIRICRLSWATPTASRSNRTSELTQRRATTHLAVQVQYDESTRQQVMRYLSRYLYPGRSAEPRWAWAGAYC